MQLERLVTFERSDVAAEDIVIREELVPLLPDRFSLFVSVSLSLSLQKRTSRRNIVLVLYVQKKIMLLCHVIIEISDYCLLTLAWFSGVVLILHSILHSSSTSTGLGDLLDGTGRDVFHTDFPQTKPVHFGRVDALTSSEVVNRMHPLSIAAVSRRSTIHRPRSPPSRV